MSFLKKTILESTKVKQSLIFIEKEINFAIDIITKKIKNGGKVFLCGNGGSAADAQHLAAEFLVRLRPHVNRYPIPALSLATDTSTLTACSNDYSFTKIFSRNLQALGSSKDVLIALSTSGNSLNILDALKVAKKKKIFTIGFLGNKGGKAKKLCNIKLIVQSNLTTRIQESHIFLGHYIIESVENKLLK
jgi:D-sedoheptulose 7-phosphate isomerase